MFHKKVAGEFRTIFGMALPTYIDAFLMFDVIKFDEDLRVPDGISTKNFVKHKYGVDAVALVEELISA